jgi:hypothetical protein
MKNSVNIMITIHQKMETQPTPKTSHICYSAINSVQISYGFPFLHLRLNLLSVIDIEIRKACFET